MRDIIPVFLVLVFITSGCMNDLDLKKSSSSYEYPTFFGSTDFIKLPSSVYNEELEFIPKSIEAFKEVISLYRDSLFYAGDH
ncbi:MAG: hypothetical protein KC517_00315 [Bacteroidetes bacterium]|jgi:hypothetical protein|nr:hypothetical protein [Bacteroidota bacterium]